jgi:hypothetical protein
MERSHVKALEEEEGSTKAHLQVPGSTKLELEFNLVSTLVAQSPQHLNVSRLFFTIMCVYVCVFLMLFFNAFEIFEDD